MEFAKVNGVEIVIPKPTEEVGRPDLRGIMWSVVGDNNGKREGKGYGAKTGVVVSGPDGMLRLVRNVCSELVGEGRDVEVRGEKFGW